MSCSNSQNFRAVKEVVSAGFSTTVFPHAKAGAIFQASMRRGKFQGIICAHTPKGWGLFPGKA